MIVHRWTCPLGHHTEVEADVGLGAPSTADRYCPHVDEDADGPGSICYRPMRCTVTYRGAELMEHAEPHPHRQLNYEHGIWRRPDLDAWRRENGYVLALWTGRPTGDDPDEVAAIGTTATGQGQIIVGNTGWVTDRYTYPGMAEAVTGLVWWKMRAWADEPKGWHRHQPSDRRRPDGDPDQEYIAP